MNANLSRTLGYSACKDEDQSMEKKDTLLRDGGRTGFGDSLCHATEAVGWATWPCPTVGKCLLIRSWPSDLLPFDGWKSVAPKP
ncbi:hypothetical protein GQ457_14G012950 [Hibiscus cannabinus]